MAYSILGTQHLFSVWYFRRKWVARFGGIQELNSWEGFLEYLNHQVQVELNFDRLQCCSSLLSSVGRRRPVRHGLTIPRLGLVVRHVQVLGRSDPTFPGIPPGAEPGHGRQIRERPQVRVAALLEPNPKAHQFLTVFRLCTS